MILEKKIVADNSVVYPDELRIPLTKHIKKLRYASKFNLFYFFLSLVCTIPYGLTYLRLSYNGESIADWWKLWAFFAFMFTLFALMIWRNIKEAKIKLQLYENGVPDFIFLDKNGIKFPVALFSSPVPIHDTFRKKFIDAGVFSLNLAWQEILAWNVEDKYTSKYTYLPPRYDLQVKHGILLGNEEFPYRDFVSIERVLSGKEEKKLLDFAQHFLNVKIKKPSWRLFWILVFVPVFLVIVGWIVKNGR